MLSDIITKKVSVRIIRILIEKKASLSEIARETDTTKANVFNSIHELEKIDIARKEIKGRTHIYRFNYLHPQAKEVLFRFIKKKQEEYITKMKGIPVLVHHTLSHMLGKKYEGVLFFGSSIDGNYQDIDAFVLAKDIQERKIQEQLKIIHPKLSMTLGTLKELRHGFEEEDMLYTNIILGIPFGCEHSILEIRHKKFLTRRIDIVERFIIGYREILSCLTFTEKEYVKKHLEKGIMDIIYTSLAYKEILPRNSKQAKSLFKDTFGFSFSHNVMTAKKQAEKIGEKIL